MTTHLCNLRNSFHMNLYAQSQHKLRTETQYQSHQSLVTAPETTTSMFLATHPTVFREGMSQASQ